MTRSEYLKLCKEKEVELAGIMARLHRVSLAQVQLWTIQFHKENHHAKIQHHRVR